MAHSVMALPCAILSTCFLTGCVLPTYSSNTRLAPLASTYFSNNLPLTNGPGPPTPFVVSENHAEVSAEPGTPVIRAQHSSEARLQIYSGEFQISSPDIDASAERLVAAVTALGGYLQSRSNVSVTVRVPSSHFQALVDQLDEIGTVGEKWIKTDDVTDQYQDLGLRLSVLDASRQRLLQLVERAANVDELLKLEEQLSKVTLEIESLKGNLKKLDSQITYSTVKVQFKRRSFAGLNHPSPFAWINRLGPEHVLSGFQMEADIGKAAIVSKWFTGRKPVDVPDGFVLLKSSRDELQAISPDDARVWYREFDVSNDASLDFWTKAVRTHLVEHQGCRLVDESEVSAENTMFKRRAHQMLLAASSDRGPLLHLLTISVKPRTLRPGHNTVQITEFTAPPELYEEYRGAVGLASDFPIAVRVQIEETGPMLLSTHP